MEPLVLLVGENLLLLSRASNQLQQMKYRVHTKRDPSATAAAVREHLPIFVLLDLTCRQGDPCAAIAELKADEKLKHIPIRAFADHTTAALLEGARAAGAEVVTSNSAIAQHLPQLIDRVLEM
jgi:two-component system cell cycle response regulator DivK